MTWKELKTAIRDLGFEENEAMDEMKSIVITSVNLSQSEIYRTVVKPNQFYFTEIEKEEVKPPTRINSDTENDFKIELPEMVIDLLPLLASYFVWQDDDATKAAVYKNQYEDVKDMLMVEFNRPQKLIFGEGVMF